MAALLVSVRDAAEAVEAWRGGAAVIDVKEPDRGPLGRADRATWRAVRDALPAGLPVSVALGELSDRAGLARLGPGDFEGLAYRKLGLAGAGPDWVATWARLRSDWGAGPAWVAVAYADWRPAGAPDPDAVLDAARAAGCAGILVDTFDKSRPSPVDRGWSPWFDRARAADLRIALAGGLDEAAIGRFAPLRPDLIAVRGAACVRGDRRAAIDPRRVARLARAAAAL